MFGFLVLVIMSGLWELCASEGCVVESFVGHCEESKAMLD